MPSLTSCRHCGTEIAEKALICYRCGTATAEPRFKAPSAPPPAGSRLWIGAAIALLVIVAVLFVVYFLK